jgi:hypothetical protein
LPFCRTIHLSSGEIQSCLNLHSEPSPLQA